jgi:hypothetical protein
MRKDIEALEAALRRVSHERIEVAIVNDPEDPALLAPYRLDLDQSQTVEIGETVQPVAD